MIRIIGDLTPVLLTKLRVRGTIWLQVKDASVVRVDRRQENLIAPGPLGIAQGLAFAAVNGIVALEGWQGELWAIASIPNAVLDMVTSEG